MTASTLTNLQTSSATQRQALPSTRRTRSARSARQPSVSRVPVHAQANRNGIQRDSQATPSYAAMKLLSAMAAAQLALSGAAVAGINDPVLPGAKVTSKDLPDGPKPLDALKGSGGGDIGKAISSASDKAGEKTPDVNVPGFGPFKFNPKEDAKQAAKKSPLGFLRAAGMTNAPSLTIQANKMLLADLPSLPGSNVSKDDLPDGPKPLGKLDIGGGNSAGQAASAASDLSDKAGEATPDVNIPGFGTFKGNPKEDAKQAKNKASELTSSLPKPLGYMHIGELAFDLPSLPGSNVKKTDLPDGPKFPVSGGGGLDNSSGQAASAVSSLSDKAGESTPDVDIPGFGTFKGNPKEDAKQAASNLSDLASGISPPSG